MTFITSLCNMAESMPAEASRLRVLRLEWLVGGQQCGGFGGGQASHGVHEPTFFRGPPGLERRVAPGKCSHLLSNLLAAGSESIGSDLLALKGWKKASQRFSRRPLPTAVWSSLAVESCRVGGMLAAVFTLIMFKAFLRPGEKLSLTPSSFLAPTDGGVPSWVVLLFPQIWTARSKT